MANKEVKKFENKVYIRKILRNRLKAIYETNKIANIWHQIKGKPYYKHVNKEKMKNR